MLRSGWYFLSVLLYMASPSSSVVPYNVDHVVILGAQFDQSIIEAISSARSFFHFEYRPTPEGELYKKEGRIAVIARNVTVDDWHLFTSDFSRQEETFNETVAKISKLEVTTETTDLAKPLKIAGDLFNQSTSPGWFKVVHVLITGRDPISKEAEEAAKELRDEDVWVYVLSEGGQRDELLKITGSDHSYRLKSGTGLANWMAGEFRKFDENFYNYACTKEVTCRYTSDKHEKCVKAIWTPITYGYNYPCGHIEPPHESCSMDECKLVCNKWWPMEKPCTDATCDQKIFRVRRRRHDRSQSLDACGQSVKCEPCPGKQATLSIWAIAVIVVVAIVCILGGIVGARFFVRRQRLRRAMKSAKREGGATTVGVGGGTVQVKEKEEFKYEFDFGAKSGYVILDDKSAVSSKRKSLGKSAVSDKGKKPGGKSTRS